MRDTSVCPAIRDGPHRSEPRIGIRRILIDGPVGTVKSAAAGEGRLRRPPPV